MKSRLPQGYGGGAQNMQAMVRQAQKMQEEMQEKQAELFEKEYDISAGGGAVALKINGKKEVLSLTISPEVIDPDDAETLQDLIVAAVNEGIKTVEGEAEKVMSGITGGMNIPGMF